MQFGWVRVGEFDEGEAIGAGRIIGCYLSAPCVVGEGAHGVLPFARGRTVWPRLTAMTVRIPANQAMNSSIHAEMEHCVQENLDGFDLRLLAALQDNGRLTNQEVGERIGLSPSQCSRRRSALEASGLIRGYRADLAAEALGFGLLVFINVTLAAHSRDNARAFRDLIACVD